MSGDIHIDINLENENRVEKALRRGLGNGLADAGNWLLDKAEERAKDIIMLEDRVWNKRVKHGFKKEENQFSRNYHWQGKLLNTAPHAKVVDRGLAPAGEITGSTPSVEDILPWVDSEVTPNAAARARAESANIENWDAHWQALAETYGTADVIAAFAIATHIRNEGYPGIRFVAQTESYMRSQTVNVKQKVEREMNKELRQMGLK